MTGPHIMGEQCTEPKAAAANPRSETECGRWCDSVNLAQDTG